jgi:hypothetical protein
MAEEIEKIPMFDDEQRAYFQRQLAAQSGKALVLAPEMLTAAQKAEQAHTSGDFSELLKDIRVRQEYLAKFGTREFERQNWVHRQNVKAKAKAAEQEKLLQDRARRTTRGRMF